MSADVGARIAHRLTCSRCRMGWTCGGLGEDDLENGERIADLLAEAKAEALREAAKDLPGFDDIRTHGDAADWLRRRANRIASEVPDA